jgi:ketosteroid isomerase-like protein
MQHSDEVREAIDRFYERISAGDVDGTAATLAGAPETFVIGTQRIGDGRASWLESIGQNAAYGVRFEAEGGQAFAIGDGGLAVDEVSLVLPNGMRIPTRVTSVLERQGDALRIVHQHYSVAVPDDVAMQHASDWHTQLTTTA